MCASAPWDWLPPKLSIHDVAGLWTQMKGGGLLHDGRFATLGEAINHHSTPFKLGLTEQEANDVAEHLKSLQANFEK